jgi:plasmid stability protein
MATLTIRDLDERLKARLRVRAAQHGRSMEDEVRVILRAAVAERGVQEGGLARAISRRFSRLRGVELVLPEREPIRDPPVPR